MYLSITNIKRDRTEGQIITINSYNELLMTEYH